MSPMCMSTTPRLTRWSLDIPLVIPEVMSPLPMLSCLAWDIGLVMIITITITIITTRVISMLTAALPDIATITAAIIAVRVTMVRMVELPAARVITQAPGPTIGEALPPGHTEVRMRSRHTIPIRTVPLGKYEPALRMVHRGERQSANASIGRVPATAATASAPDSWST